MTAPHRFPGTREEALESMLASRAEIEAIIEKLSDEQMTGPVDDGGWSIKDHLAHIAEWQRRALGILEGRRPHEALNIPEEDYPANDIDALNEILFQRNKDRALNDVRSDFRKTHEQAITAVERMNDDDLERELPPEISPNRRHIADVVMGFAGHDNEHVEDIRALANEQ